MLGLLMLVLRCIGSRGWVDRVYSGMVGVLYIFSDVMSCYGQMVGVGLPLFMYTLYMRIDRRSMMLNAT